MIQTEISHGEDDFKEHKKKKKQRNVSSESRHYVTKMMKSQRNVGPYLMEKKS